MIILGYSDYRPLLRILIVLGVSFCSILSYGQSNVKLPKTLLETSGSLRKSSIILGGRPLRYSKPVLGDSALLRVASGFQTRQEAKAIIQRFRDIGYPKSNTHLFDAKRIAFNQTFDDFILEAKDISWVNFDEYRNEDWFSLFMWTDSKSKTHKFRSLIYNCRFSDCTTMELFDPYIKVKNCYLSGKNRFRLKGNEELRISTCRSVGTIEFTGDFDHGGRRSDVILEASSFEEAIRVSLIDSLHFLSVGSVFDQSLTITEGKKCIIEIDNCKLPSVLEIENCDLVGLEINRSIFGHNLILNDVGISDPVSLEKCILPDTITVKRLQSSDGAILDFSDCLINSQKLNQNNKYKVRLNLDPSSIPFMSIPGYGKNFRLSLSQSSTFERTSSIYQALLLRYNELMFKDSYEALDKEWKETVYLHNGFVGIITNTLQKYWWDYGYSKWWIFLWSIGCVLLFSIINTLILKYFITKIYQPETAFDIEQVKQDWKELSHIKRFRKHFTTTVYFTGLIFFAIQFEPRRLVAAKGEYGQNLGALIYFLLIYATGLVCLGYIANLVIS